VFTDGGAHLNSSESALSLRTLSVPEALVFASLIPVHSWHFKASFDSAELQKDGAF
jgi:hypothetical protein